MNTESTAYKCHPVNLDLRVIKQGYCFVHNFRHYIPVVAYHDIWIEIKTTDKGKSGGSVILPEAFWWHRLGCFAKQTNSILISVQLSLALTLFVMFNSSWFLVLLSRFSDPVHSFSCLLCLASFVLFVDCLTHACFWPRNCLSFGIVCLCL